MLSKAFNLVIGVGGGVLGLLVFFLPEANKLLAVVLMVALLLLFTPFAHEEEGGEFASAVEIGRYLCVAWGVVVAVQQYVTVEFVDQVPRIAASTAFDIREERRVGRLPDVAVVELSRNPHFIAGSSFLVQATDNENAFAVPFEPWLLRMAERAGAPFEDVLFTAGAMLAIFAALLRLVGLIIARLPSVSGAGAPGGSRGS